MRNDFPSLLLVCSPTYRAFQHANQLTTDLAFKLESGKCAYVWHSLINLVETWYGISKWKHSTYVSDS